MQLQEYARFDSPIFSTFPILRNSIYARTQRISFFQQNNNCITSRYNYNVVPEVL